MQIQASRRHCHTVCSGAGDVGEVIVASCASAGLFCGNGSVSASGVTSIASSSIAEISTAMVFVEASRWVGSSPFCMSASPRSWFWPVEGIVFAEVEVLMFDSAAGGGGGGGGGEAGVCAWSTGFGECGGLDSCWLKCSGGSTLTLMFAAAVEAHVKVESGRLTGGSAGKAG